MFKLTLGDCEYIESNRFILQLTETNKEQLLQTIITNIWEPNRYGVQSKTYDSYLIGYDSLQEFIQYTAVNSTFWGLVPFQLICLASVSFHPYNSGDCRWNVLVEFGSSNEFKYTNFDPNSNSANNKVHNDNESSS